MKILYCTVLFIAGLSPLYILSAAHSSAFKPYVGPAASSSANPIVPPLEPNTTGRTEARKQWFALIKNGDVSKIDEFLRKIPNGKIRSECINSTDNNNNTALIIAASNDNIEVVKYLINTARANLWHLHAEKKSAFYRAPHHSTSHRLITYNMLHQVLNSLAHTMNQVKSGLILNQNISDLIINVLNDFKNCFTEYPDLKTPTIAQTIASALNTKDKNGITLLMHAAQANLIELVLLLLEYDADVTITNESDGNRKALDYLIGESETIISLKTTLLENEFQKALSSWSKSIEQIHNSSTIDTKALTAILRALYDLDDLFEEYPHLKTTAVAEKITSEINTKNKGGMTLLMQAAQASPIKLVPLLLTYGADASIVNESDRKKKAINYIRGESKTTISIKEALLESELQKVLSSWNNIIHQIQNSSVNNKEILAALMQALYDIDNLLEEYPHLKTKAIAEKITSEINTRNRRGMTLLMQAAQLNIIDLVSLLLEYGADIMSKNELDHHKRAADYAIGDSRTHLHIKMGLIKTEEDFINAIDSIRVLNDTEITILENAQKLLPLKSKDGTIKVLKEDERAAIFSSLLLKDPVVIADIEKSLKVFTTSSQNSEERGKLLEKIRLPFLKKLLMDRLKEKTRSFNTISPTIITQWFLAAQQDNRTLLSTLLEKYPLLLHVKDDSGSTALHKATQAHKHDIIIFLIQKGAIDSRKKEPAILADLTNNEGDTPLIIAAREGNSETVYLLASELSRYKTIFNARNNKGFSAYTAAGHPAIKDILVHAGADPAPSTEKKEAASKQNYKELLSKLTPDERAYFDSLPDDAAKDAYLEGLLPA